jgi:hypothetical protein
MTSRLAYRQNVETLHNRLGDRVAIDLISWNRSDLSVDDLVDRHFVVAPALRSLPTALQPCDSTPVTATRTLDEVRAEQASVEGERAGLVGLAEEPAFSGEPPSLSDHDQGPSSEVGDPRRRTMRSLLGGAKWATLRWVKRSRRRMHPRALARRAKASNAGKATRRVVKGSLARQFAHEVTGPRVRGVVLEADVIVAMDGASLRAAWWLARKTPHPVVVYGLDAAVRAVALLDVKEPVLGEPTG